MGCQRASTVYSLFRNGKYSKGAGIYSVHGRPLAMNEKDRAPKCVGLQWRALDAVDHLVEVWKFLDKRRV